MKFIFIILMLLPAFYNIPAQTIEEWAERYNGPRNSTDDVSSLATDSSGNVYVTGSSVGSGNNYDFTTIKYNPAGDSVWVVRFNGAADEDDFAYAIATDAAGNVYVTGSSNNNLLNTKIATVKYNSSGVQLWAKTFSGPAKSFDMGISVAVDAAGNVYVTGISNGIETGNDYATIKYDSSGTQQWVSRYNYSFMSSDQPSKITLDGSGNVYVTGKSYNTVSSFDYATLKYNASGDLLWAAKYNGTGNGDDEAYSLAADGNGNVYVTGVSFDSDTFDDYTIIKYNSSGDSVWVKRYNGPGNSEDISYSIAVDIAGNVFVTGKSIGNGTSGDYATIKYNTSGNQIWVSRYNGTGNYNDEASSLALDGSGNVYVTGKSYGDGTYYDFATIKYNPFGDSVWVERYDGSDNFNDYAKSIAVNSAGNVYITGSSDGTGSYADYATIKYSTITGIKQTSSGNPEQFSLSQNYPNPFNPVTKINYELKITNYVSVIVYDVLGNEVRSLVNENKPAGSYEVVFDGNNLSSGIYFYSLFINGNVMDTKRMVLFK